MKRLYLTPRRFGKSRALQLIKEKIMTDGFGAAYTRTEAEKDFINQGTAEDKNKDTFNAILIQLAKLHSAKDHDYSGAIDPYANIRECEKMGIEAWKGIVIRMGDKMARLQTFSRQGTLNVKDESIIDTFRDMAVYSIIGILMHNEHTLDAKVIQPREDHEACD